MSSVQTTFANFLRPDGSDTVVCPTNGRVIGEPKGFLQLRDGGEGAGFITELSVLHEVMSSCPEQIGVRCGDLSECESTSCGLCQCGDYPLEISPDSVYWSRSGTQLNLNLGEKRSFEYCVDGDVLSLRSPDDIVLHFQRVHAYGKPLPCDERAIAECTGPSKLARDACHIGVCVGDKASCAQARSEASCTNQQGCSWDVTQCGGAPAQYCGPDDYGVLPGCELSDGPAVCTGTPPECGGFDVETCPTDYGCTVEFSCSGPSMVCDELWEDESYCPTGCHCESSWEGCYCTGTSDCSKAKDEDLCTSNRNYGCTWGGTCGGSFNACSTLDENDCYTVPGCRLVAK